MHRFIVAALFTCSILSIMCAIRMFGCTSKEEREREQLDREQKQMMVKLLTAEAEQMAHDGCVPLAVAVDAGAH